MGNPHYEKFYHLQNKNLFRTYVLQGLEFYDSILWILTFNNEAAGFELMIHSKVLVAFSLRKVKTDHQKSFCLDDVTFLWGHFAASLCDFRAIKRSMYKLIE